MFNNNNEEEENVDMAQAQLHKLCLSNEIKQNGKKETKG